MILSALNVQLLDEAEHDIKNYSDRGQSYLPKPIFFGMTSQPVKI